jgi:hypothetical protein
MGCTSLPAFARVLTVLQRDYLEVFSYGLSNMGIIGLLFLSEGYTGADYKINEKLQKGSPTVWYGKETGSELLTNFYWCFSHWHSFKIGFIKWINPWNRSYLSKKTSWRPHILLRSRRGKKTGDVDWATSSVDLINLAVSSAKYRFIVVGDKRIWASLEFVSTVHRNMEEEMQKQTIPNWAVLGQQRRRTVSVMRLFGSVL